MPSPIIKAYLLTDTVDTTAQNIANLNPLVFPSSAYVPRYMYTSLCTLWTGVSGNVGALANDILAISGAGLSTSRNVISISTTIHESSDLDEEDMYISDFTGAESGLLTILISTSKSPTDINLTQDTELRIRWLIDSNLRALRGVGQNIPIYNLPTNNLSGDTSILAANSVFGCKWLRYEADQNAQELASEYAITYQRAFGKGVGPP